MTTAGAGRRGARLLPAGAAVPLLLVVAWELAMRLAPPSDTLAPPSRVLAALLAGLADGSIVLATGQTLLAALGGLALGAGAGGLAGIALGLSRPFARFARAPVEALRPLPSVALIPLALIAFGFGHAMGIAIVAFATFWPTLVLAQGAVGGVDRQLLEVGRALELGPVARVTKIVLPAALPRLVVALRLAAGVALVVAVTVELTANPQGLGYGLVIAQQSLKPDVMLAHLAWIGLLGLGLNQGLIALERRLAPPGHAAPSQAGSPGAAA